MSQRHTYADKQPGRANYTLCGQNEREKSPFSTMTGLTETDSSMTGSTRGEEVELVDKSLSMHQRKLVTERFKATTKASTSPLPTCQLHNLKGTVHPQKK